MRDIRCNALAESWQRTGRLFAGLVFSHRLHGSMGEDVRNLPTVRRLERRSSSTRKQHHTAMKTPDSALNILECMGRV
jgi:hypothetical protein